MPKRNHVASEPIKKKTKLHQKEELDIFCAESFDTFSLHLHPGPIDDDCVFHILPEDGGYDADPWNALDVNMENDFMQPLPAGDLNSDFGLHGAFALAFQDSETSTNRLLRKLCDLRNAQRYQLGSVSPETLHRVATERRQNAVRLVRFYEQNGHTTFLAITILDIVSTAAPTDPIFTTSDEYDLAVAACILLASYCHGNRIESEKLFIRLQKRFGNTTALIAMKERIRGYLERLDPVTPYDLACSILDTYCAQCQCDKLKLPDGVHRDEVEASKSDVRNLLFMMERTTTYGMIKYCRVASALGVLEMVFSIHGWDFGALRPLLCDVFHKSELEEGEQIADIIERTHYFDRKVLFAASVPHVPSTPTSVTGLSDLS